MRHESTMERKKKIVGMILALTVVFAVLVPGRFSLQTHAASNKVSVFELYNPAIGEYYYTTSGTVVQSLVAGGWTNLGIGWEAPSWSNVPVYCLRNAKTNLHMFTADETAKGHLVQSGWIQECIAFYSADDRYTYGDSTSTSSTSSSSSNETVTLGLDEKNTTAFGIVRPIYRESTGKAAGTEVYRYGLAKGNGGEVVWYGCALTKKGALDSTVQQRLNAQGRNLRDAYKYCVMQYSAAPTDPSIGATAYGALGLTSHTGNSYVMASTLTALARGLGYNAIQVSGTVSGSPHSWVEIDGKIYDPEFESETGRSGYALTYGSKGIWSYAAKAGVWY